MTIQTKKKKKLSNIPLFFFFCPEKLQGKFPALEWGAAKSSKAKPEALNAYKATDWNIFISPKNHLKCTFQVTAGRRSVCLYLRYFFFYQCPKVLFLNFPIFCLPVFPFQWVLTQNWSLSPLQADSAGTSQGKIKVFYKELNHAVIKPRSN